MAVRFGVIFTHTVQTIISHYRCCNLFSIKVLPDFFLSLYHTSSSEKNRRNSERLRLTFVEWTETNPTLFFPMFSDWWYHLFCPGEPFYYITIILRLINSSFLFALSMQFPADGL